MICREHIIDISLELALGPQRSMDVRNGHLALECQEAVILLPLTCLSIEDSILVFKHTLEPKYDDILSGRVFLKKYKGELEKSRSPQKTSEKTVRGACWRYSK